MNGIEKITARILQDAQTEIDDVLGKAKAEADAIHNRYETQAQREYDELTRRGLERAQEREENLAGAALLECRKETLAAKQSMLDRAFALAAEQLKKLPKETYISLLAHLAANASYHGRESIILSETDAKAHGEAILREANALLQKNGKPANLRLSEHHVETGGGLLLSNGNIETNCTFETLLRLSREELSGEVAKTLFA